MGLRLYEPGAYVWQLHAQFPDRPDAAVAGHGLIHLTETESELAIAGRLVRELGGPELSGLDSTITITIRPVRGAR
ncbi:hypothetical protein [Streptomyces vinaceus]|uniref:hypothetical protein n=1 Tax=Streptomyces vinaceus TaxID=1960 RepID=UPI00367F5222